MTEVTDTQKKRAVNIIWGAARDYSFTPDFKAYDADGNAELYWNCIIGAVRRQYEYSKLETVFRSFKDLEDSDLYESLLWLGLENCVFAKESPERPALAYLRRAYAEKVVAAYSPETSGDLGEAMCLGARRLCWRTYCTILHISWEINGSCVFFTNTCSLSGL